MSNHEATFFAGRDKDLLEIVRDLRGRAINGVSVRGHVMHHSLVELAARHFLLRIKSSCDVQEADGRCVGCGDLRIDFLDGETLRQSREVVAALVGEKGTYPFGR